MSPPADRPDHVLLTRFNLPSPGYERAVRAEPGWLRRRVELFERWCLPSVSGQTSTRFSWIVYFDPASPDWLIRRICTWTYDTPLTPIFRAEVGLADKLADMRRAVGTAGTRLLTTNLDNDDGLAGDFVARLQAEAPATGRHALYLATGLIVAGDRVFLRVDRRNAFCSVCEDWDGAITCWAAPHNALGRLMPVKVVGGAPGWLQVVHGHNVSNRIKGMLVSPKPYADLFDAELTEIPCPSRLAIGRDRLVDRPARWFRDAVRSIAKLFSRALLGRGGTQRVKLLLGAVKHRR